MKKILLPVLLILAFQYGFSQLPTIKFDHFTVRDGLPERQVQFIKQDSRGYIWMGTQNGLVKYDGYKPKVYRFGVGNNSIFSSCSIISMLENGDKTLWFSTVGNGIFRYNPATDNFTQFKYPQKKAGRDFFDFSMAFTGNDNNLWGYMYSFANNGAQLVKFNTKTGAYELYDKTQRGAHFLADYNIISKTADGRIILGTNNGLFTYNYKTVGFDGDMTSPDPLTRVKIDHAYEAPSEPGIIWMSLLDTHLKKKIIRRFNTRLKLIKDYYPSSVPRLNSGNDSINAIFEDKGKRLWFATQHGLMLLDRKTGGFTNYMPADTGKELLKSTFYSVIEGRNGTLWLSSGKGILNFDTETHEFKRYTANPDDPYSVSGSESGINDMILDRSGLLWVAFSNHEVDRENGVTSVFSIWSKQSALPESYPGSKTASIIRDKEGSVLFTNKAGIYKWRPGSNTFTMLYKKDVRGKYMSSIAFDKEENIYFSLDNGLALLNKKAKLVHIYSNIPNDTTSISKSVISEVIVDHTGLVWIATSDQGLNSFDPATQKFKRYPFIENDGLTDSKGKVDDKSVITVYEDREGNIWTGTNFGGLSRFDRKTGKFKSYLLSGGMRVPCVASIFEDREGRIWAGSYLDGLFEFNAKPGRYVRHVNEGTGLLFNTVDDILQDEKGFIWAGSARGLTRLNPTDGAIKTFLLNVILPGTSATLTRNSFVSWNNSFILGQANSIAMFNPADLAGNAVPPEVHIESIDHNNPGAEKEVPAKLQTYGLNNVYLPWNQNRVTISYVALHFVNPAQNKYAYFLEGYDKQWVQAGAQRQVTYTNLSPGTYTFRVKAANSDGVWNNKGDSFIITIRPPWWFTWWAWLLYAVLFAGSIYLFIKYRSRHLMRENQVLEEKVNVRTKQLNEQQEEITAQRDQLAETVTHLKATQTQLIQSEKMASLGELTAGIAHEIQNPLNFVNNFSEVSVELTQELKEELKNGNTEDAIAIADDLELNLGKIHHHGKRADFIVKGMLQHSRTSTGERQQTNINTLAGEFLKLSYHGLRAKDKSFNAELVTNFDESLPRIDVAQQDIGRVLLNLFNNAFYAVQQKQKTAGSGYKPAVEVSSKADEHWVEIKVKDNGVGISDAIKEKIMQPFFTTKPTGEGTGLGLSLSYDIVVKGHGGKIDVNSKEGVYTEFVIMLPLS